MKAITLTGIVLSVNLLVAPTTNLEGLPLAKSSAATAASAVTGAETNLAELPLANLSVATAASGSSNPVQFITPKGGPVMVTVSQILLSYNTLLK